MVASPSHIRSASRHQLVLWGCIWRKIKHGEAWPEEDRRRTQYEAPAIGKQKRERGGVKAFKNIIFALQRKTITVERGYMVHSSPYIDRTWQQ